MNGEVAFQTNKIRLFYTPCFKPIQVNEIASLFLHLQVVNYTFILSSPIFYMLVFPQAQGIYPIQLNEITSLFLHLQVVMYTFILSYPIFYMFVFHTRKKRKCVYLKTMAWEVAFESVEIYVI
jgi:hypothetical protein